MDGASQAADDSGDIRCDAFFSLEIEAMDQFCNGWALLWASWEWKGGVCECCTAVEMLWCCLSNGSGFQSTGTLYNPGMNHVCRGWVEGRGVE